MPDIAMCPGGECPLKYRCHRFMTTPSTLQSYFTNPPFKGQSCEHLIDIGKTKKRMKKKLERARNDQ